MILHFANSFFLPQLLRKYPCTTTLQLNFILLEYLNQNSIIAIFENLYQCLQSCISIHYIYNILMAGISYSDSQMLV